MSTKAVLAISRELLELNKRLQRRQMRIGAEPEFIIDVLLIRARMSGLCSAMAVVAADVQYHLSGPDDWHEVKLRQFVKAQAEKASKP